MALSIRLHTPTLNIDGCRLGGYESLLPQDLEVLFVSVKSNHYDVQEQAVLATKLPTAGWTHQYENRCVDSGDWAGV